MDKPVTDGQFTIHFNDGQEVTWKFAEIDAYFYSHSMLVVRKPGNVGRFEYPVSNVQSVSIQYNSQEYLTALKAWSEEAHAMHLDSEPDFNCLKCAEDAVRTARAGLDEF